MVDIVGLRQELYSLLVSNAHFGRTESFYQSLPQLGIEGLRPTLDRIEMYNLRPLVEGKSVLDIGCNTGFMDISLAPYAKNIDGLEFYGVSVEIGNRVNNALGITNVNIMQGDFKQATLAEGARGYDVVLSFAVHLWIGLPPESYAKKVKSLIAPGGYLLFESQDIKVDEIFLNHCAAFEAEGFTEEKRCDIKDDGKTIREWRLYKAGEANEISA